MSLSASSDYRIPVMVNGYSCRNCDDVESAKKNVDPAAKIGGPASETDKTRSKHDEPAFALGGGLAVLELQDSRDACAAPTVGSRVDICC